ncbi:glycosyltransferase [Nocardioides sp.]|uniref:glycosyltransferase n=1 Tax=Nocardioides sp. TaxID=35761 RepID=UPI003563BF05
MPARDSADPGRLHVLHVSVPTTEGVAAVQETYVRDQLERGWAVSVACPSTGWWGYAARDLGADVNWWNARRDPGPDILAEAHRLRRIVRRTRPDVVHLHSAKAGLVGRMVLRGRVPTLFQPHAWSFMAATGAVGRASLTWERVAARWTTELICVSESERTDGEQQGVVAPTSVVPNGVDLRLLQPAGDDERLAARAELGLDDAPTVVCVGRLAPQKGQSDLLDAWQEVRARIPDARLVLVGDGPDRELLERRVVADSGVRLVGSRADVPSWLAAADVVAVPSLWEGMALVPLEAMARARSVVVSDVTGVAESVPEGAGAIVPPGSPDDLAEALVTRLADPHLCAEEGLAGRSHVEARHDSATAAQDVARVCLRLAGRQRRST